MGDVGVFRGFAGFFCAVSVADGFEGFVGFAFEEFGIVIVAEFFGGLVAIFLEDVNLAREPAENANGAGEFFGFGIKLLAGFGFEEELGKLSGGELKADFGGWLASLVRSCARRLSWRGEFRGRDPARCTSRDNRRFCSWRCCAR